MNLLLRNYLHYNLYDQADKLVSKSVFPESANNNQLARYMYYLGRIRAIQLDYTASHRFLQQAIRKAPQNVATTGFNQTVLAHFAPMFDTTDLREIVATTVLGSQTVDHRATFDGRDSGPSRLPPTAAAKGPCAIFPHYSG
jgi:hypothetical protein